MPDHMSFSNIKRLAVFRSIFAIGLSVMLAAPASATCLLTEQPLQNASVTLIRQGSARPIVRLTDGNGLLSLRNLRRGSWQATFNDGGEAFPFQIARDRRASLIAVEQTTRCSAPPHPNAPPQPPTTRRVLKQAMVTTGGPSHSNLRMAGGAQVPVTATWEQTSGTAIITVFSEDSIPIADMSAFSAAARGIQDEAIKHCSKCGVTSGRMIPGSPIRGDMGYFQIRVAGISGPLTAEQVEAILQSGGANPAALPSRR